MPRETKDERILREAQEQAAAEAALESYRLTVPKRLMDAAAQATQLGISVNVRLGEDGPIVGFYDSNLDIDDSFTYETEQWELEQLENILRDIGIKQAQLSARRVLAREVWDGLTPTQKTALKENIQNLV